MDDTFAAQYKNPMWQKKRLEALDEAGFECQNCGSEDDQLHVHHKSYIKGRRIWDYGLHELFVLCDKCHKIIHKQHDDLKQLLSFDSDIGHILSLVAGLIEASVDERDLKHFGEKDPILYSAAKIAYKLYAFSVDPCFVEDLDKSLPVIYNNWRCSGDA